MKAFSELTSASQVNNGDLVAISQTSGSGYASKKTTVKDITDKSNLNLAEEYDSTSTYAVDDYVIYESVLYKCIGTTTGTFDSTKWTSVVVTDEMGSGGGGGTGGHTIIDENGNSMTARAGLQFVGGANVSDDSTNNKTIVDLASAGGIDGVFIDTDNIIQASATLTAGTEVTYTATEDCVVDYLIYSKGNSIGYIKINDINVLSLISGSTEDSVGMRNTIFVKKGQIVKLISYINNGSYTVYGIQTGTTHSKFQPVIYSATEREIGVWTDGKPLYEKTFNLSKSDFTKVSAGIYQFTGHGISNIDKIIDIEGILKTSSFGIVKLSGKDYSSNTSDSASIELANYYNGVMAYDRGNPVLENDANWTCNLTYRYTKTTDVAGSGSWTPQGVPTHHYSTDEQIIGTWIDGKTLYEKTYDRTTNPISLPQSNEWTNTGISNTGIDKIISYNAMSSAGSNYSGVVVVAKSTSTIANNIAMQNARAGSTVIGYLILQYTKTS